MCLLLIFNSLICHGTVTEDIEDYSFSDLRFNESFDYSDAFTNHGWTYSNGGCANYPTVPLTSDFGSNAFSVVGHDCVGSATLRIYQSSNITETTGNFILRFNLRFQNDSLESTNPIYLGLMNVSGDTNKGALLFKVNTGGDNYYSEGIGGLTPQDCSIPKESPFSHEHVIQLDLTNNVYSWYINGSATGCYNKIIDTSGVFGDFSPRAVYLYVRTDGSADYVNAHIDNINFGVGSLEAGASAITTCNYPVIFCDNFNYNVSLAEKEYDVWNVFNKDSSVDLTFSPTNNQMDLISSSWKAPAHYLEPFPVEYVISSSETIKESNIAPVISTEFKIKPINNNWTITAFDRTYEKIPFELRGIPNINDSAQYDILRLHSNGSYVNVCQNCMYKNYWHTIKIISFFVDETRFNATVTTPKYDLYVTLPNNTISSYEDIPFTDDNAINQRMMYISKTELDNFSIDDYYVFIGTDKNTATIENYYENLYIIPETTNVTMTEQTGDFIDAVHTIWWDMGLRSTASRVFVGIGLMFLLALFMVGAFISYKTPISTSAIAIVEIIFMIFLVYIRLIPIWIPVVIAIISAGIGAYVFKMHASG